MEEAGAGRRKKEGAMAIVRKPTASLGTTNQLSPSEEGRPDTPAEGRVVAGGVLGGCYELADARPDEARLVRDGKFARTHGGAEGPGDEVDGEAGPPSSMSDSLAPS